jgi:hypothetical protein
MKREKVEVLICLELHNELVQISTRKVVLDGSRKTKTLNYEGGGKLSRQIQIITRKLVIQELNKLKNT